MAGMSRIVGAAKWMFYRYPLVTNSLVYGTLYVAAEFSHQTFTKKILQTGAPLAYDAKTISRFGILGVAVYPQVYYYWYRWLDKALPGTATKTIVKKLLLDQFVMTPPLLVVFFVGMSILERKEDIFAECKDKWPSTFGTSCMFWIPAQTLNFLKVTPPFRVMYVGTCAFIWINILCWIKSNNKKI